MKRFSDSNVLFAGMLLAIAVMGYVNIKTTERYVHDVTALEFILEENGIILDSSYLDR